MKFKNTKNAITCISIFCVFAVYKNSITKYLNSLCLEYHIDTWTSFIPLLILVICFTTYFFLLLIKGYVPSKTILIITILFGSIIYYSGLYYGNCAVFSCFILLFLAGQIFLFILHQIKELIRMFRNKETKGFISDEPIPVEGKDKSNFIRKIFNKLLGIKEKEAKTDNKGYAQYAQNIATKIKESHFEKSFAIGINGKWGSGKTSMSNLIKRHTKNEKDVITIDFKPWNSSTPDAIIKDFFETLQDKLSPYHAALSRLLIRYSRKLTSIDSNIITQTIEYVANYILDLDATNKVYEKINAALKDIDKKIIIYIDDVDRLAQNEIMEVIRLIRNTANFYNTFFIVSYDKAYVNNALKDAKIHSHEKFLEKIFQLEVNLPYYDKSKLREELAEKLKEGLSDEIVNIEIENEIKDLDILDNWLKHSRDVTRLSNSLLLNYEKVRGYVVFSEFLLMEILRLFNRKFYDEIRNKSEEYFENESPSIFKLKKEFSKKIEDRDKEVIEYLFKKWMNNRNTCDSLIDENDKINYSRFPIYFQSVDFRALNLKNYYKLYELNAIERKQEIEEIIKDELSSDLENRMLEDNTFSSKERLSIFIKIVLHSIEERKYYSDKLLKHLCEKIKGEKFKIDTLKRCFETLCKNIDTYNHNLLVLVNSTYKLLESKKELKNKILSPIKEFIENKALNSFLLSNISPVKDENKMQEYLDGNKNNLTFEIAKQHINKLFEDNKFEGLLYNKLSNSQVKEFKAFYDKLKENGFKAVTFDFSNIPIRDRITSILEGISTQEEGFNKLSEESGIPK